MSQACVVSVNISDTKGVVKKPIPQGNLEVGVGLVGDAHSGMDIRELSLLAEESIDIMRAQGLELQSGDFAENLTTRGLSLHTLPIGTRLAIGETVVEVSKIGKECHHGCAIKKKVGNCIMPTQGIFARIITPGVVRPGDPIRRLDGD